MSEQLNFTSFGLSSEIIHALKDKGYQNPTPIQLQAIPLILKGADVMAAAQTGTGKTGAFALPILQRLLNSKTKCIPNQSRVLILVPTRELAVQVEQEIKDYAHYLTLKSLVVYGGVKINPQMMKLRNGIDILVATPGRLLDLYQQNAVKFHHLQSLVLDEADKMLNLGFQEEIQAILTLLPKQRQTLLFSATFSDEIHRLAKKLLVKPLEISVDRKNTTATKIKQWICPVDKKRKPALLIEIMQQQAAEQVLIFSKTKKGANKLCQHLIEKNYKAAAIHGDKSQAVRTKALADFKSGKVKVLVATDIAARGLDIEQLPLVINVDLPIVAEDYIHRIGRTGRAGLSGQAISLVCADEIDLLKSIETLLKRLLDRKIMHDFEPVHDLPASVLNLKSKKIKKPKKSKNNNETKVKSKLQPIKQTFKQKNKLKKQAKYKKTR